MTIKPSHLCEAMKELQFFYYCCNMDIHKQMNNSQSCFKNVRWNWNVVWYQMVISKSTTGDFVSCLKGKITEWWLVVTEGISGNQLLLVIIFGNQTFFGSDFSVTLV